MSLFHSSPQPSLLIPSIWHWILTSACAQEPRALAENADSRIYLQGPIYSPAVSLEIWFLRKALSVLGLHLEKDGPRAVLLKL
jgi:hypothetical protein